MIEQKLANQTMMVTGSSSGIGQAIAVELATQGANVILHGRSNSPKLQQVEQTIRELGGTSTTVLADFSEPVDWDAFVGRAWDWNGRIDGWINNAGGDVLTGPWSDRSLSDKLGFLWQVDVVATLMLSKAVGKRMVAVGELARVGSRKPDFVILNMGWDQAWQGMAGESGELFSTTKGAIMAMTKSLAQSLAPQVRVNCLAPGWIKTDWGQQASDYWTKRAQRESLSNRWGDPQDIANVAAFLCSQQGSFISGQIVPVNGGFRFSTLD